MRSGAFAISVVCQCAMSFARRSGGAGRPSRGARYSSSSMPGPSSRAQRGDPQPRAEHVVQVFLLDVVVLALAGDLHPQACRGRSAATRRCRRRRSPCDRCRGTGDRVRCHFASPLPGGKCRDLEEVPIGIAEVEGADPAGVRVPVGQPLRAGRRVLDAVLAAARAYAFVHVADDDRDVLEDAIVGPHVGRHRPALRRQELGQLDRLRRPGAAGRPGMRAPKTPGQQLVRRGPETSRSDTFSNGSTRV